MTWEEFWTAIAAGSKRYSPPQIIQEGLADAAAAAVSTARLVLIAAAAVVVLSLVDRD